jgi:hypothetical protein
MELNAQYIHLVYPYNQDIIPTNASEYKGYRDRETIRILAKPKKVIDSLGRSTKNIVYKEVLI